MNLKRNNLPGTGPHNFGIISNMAEHDGSSKHNWRAKIQLNIAIAGFPCVPKTLINISIHRHMYKTPTNEQTQKEIFKNNRIHFRMANKINRLIFVLWLFYSFQLDLIQSQNRNEKKKREAKQEMKETMCGAVNGGGGKSNWWPNHYL